MNPSCYKRKKRRLASEINVVPYIDVMLVLLVIFMVTAPLLTQGVDVDLPQANAEPVQNQDQQTVVVSVDADGLLYVDVGANKNEPVDADTLKARVAAVLRNQPRTTLMIKGDQSVDYGAVVRAMVLVQEAGAPSVGLITENPLPEARR